MHPSVQCLVGVNAIWDFVSTIAIALRYEPIARWHTDLWASDDDRTNPAARSLMSWFVLTLGLARLAAVIDPATHLTCGILSYVIEGWFALTASSDGTMKPTEGLVVAIGSFALAALMIL